MPIVAAIVSLSSIALEVEGGVAALADLIQKLFVGGKLTQDDIDAIRADGALADAEFDAAIAAAKQRLA